eukprot:TRINITY_DN1737_c0_g1_i1.p1 TRINITY_DN1737_c0_g1~~TRINITY_DN1737_c0_g1_i1.p1  ORF type:complete len:424 (+),score=154.68 TRINITY_DN1737_c0_g1_i1:97-1368(+)
MEQKAALRLNRINNHFVETPDISNLSIEQTAKSFSKSDNDVVIVSALRTPIGKAPRGVFKETHVTDLLVPVLQGVLREAKLSPEKVEDVIVGNVSLFGAGATQSRTALFLAGFPDTTSVAGVNRQCASGLQAVASIANSIAAGQIDIGIGAGMESMSTAKKPEETEDWNQKIFDNELARDCLNTMGQTSENVAAKYNISRKVQDEFGFESQQKAAIAQKEGRFKRETVPVTIEVNSENGTKTITVDKDEGIRPTTLEGLNKLRPAFKEGGTTTAGNASQTSDGAAAVLLARRSVAVKLGLPILATFRHFSTVGCPPSIMGIGPAVAIPKLLSKTGLTVNDIDVFEINEAFASQALYCVDTLKIPKNKLNPNGGAIAFGHPLGCTGARMIATIVSELHRSKSKLGIVSMCMGTGMGAAALIERE